MDFHYSPDLLVRNQDFAIERMSGISTPEDTAISHIHKFYEILYVYSGSKELTINNSLVSTLDSNNIAFIAPYQFHKTHEKNNTPFKRTLINFTYNFIKADDDHLNQAMLSCFTNTSGVISFKLNQTRDIGDIFQNLLLEYNSNNDSFSEHIIRNQLRHLLLTASRAATENQEIDSHTSYRSSYYAAIRDISTYVKNNYQTKISLEAISNIFGISKYTISREFPHVIGTSFSMYLNNVRIKKSIELLIKTNKKIADIAHECGYDSIKHFNRMFKTQFNMSPTEYRKQCKLE